MSNRFEIISEDDKMVKIVDNDGGLSDLIISDKSVGEEYVNYFNKDISKEECDILIDNIIKDIIYLNNMNDELVQPEKVLRGYDESDEPVYDMKLKDNLFYIGYNNVVGNYTKNINDKLMLIKRRIFDEDDE